MEQSGAGFSETSGDTQTFLGITISIDPVIKEKESIFKFAKFYLTREIIRSSRSKNINKPWPCKASPHYDFIRGQN